MFIECAKNNGTDYLRVVEGYTFTGNGEKRHRRRVVRNIGPLSRFDDGHPEYLARLRRSFKDGEPIIESLADLVKSQDSAHPGEYANNARRISIPFNLDNAGDCFCSPKNCGYFPKLR